MPPVVSVLVTCHDLGAFLDEAISSVLEQTFADHEILVVDDGSDDATARLARSAGALVAQLPFNVGVGGALRTGFHYAIEAGFAVAVQIDADGQHDPGHIPELFRRGQSWDVVIGSRFLGRQRYRSPLSKAVGVRIFRHIIQRETGLNITDPTSGYRYMDGRAIKFCSRLRCNYPDANLIIMMHRAGMTITESPVKMQPNAAGKSMHKGKTIRYVREVFASITMEMKCRI